MSEHLIKLKKYYNQNEYCAVINYAESNDCASFLDKFNFSNLKTQANCFYYIGLAYFKLNRLEEAKENFFTVIKKTQNIENFIKTFEKEKIKIDDFHSNETATTAKTNFDQLIESLKTQQEQIQQTRIEKLSKSNLGYIHFKQENYGEAVKVFKELIKLEPENIRYNVSLAENLYKWEQKRIENIIEIIIPLTITGLIIVFILFYLWGIKISFVLFFLLVLSILMGLLYKYGPVFLAYVFKELYPFRFVFDLLFFGRKQFQKKYSETYNQCRKTIELIEKQEILNQDDYLSLCKLHYFQGKYDEAHLYAQQSLRKSPDGKRIYVYDWLSRIAYKTKNHSTASDFYQEIIKNLTDKTLFDGIETGEEDDKEIEIHPVPVLSDMVKYLQKNREIIDKRSVDRIFYSACLNSYSNRCFECFKYILCRKSSGLL